MTSASRRVRVLFDEAAIARRNEELATEILAAKPENLVYGHPGPGSQPHLGMLAVLKATDVTALGVPFQGAGPMAQALLSGTVMAITETPAVAQASGLPILAALTDERIASLPDVPTMK